MALAMEYHKRTEDYDRAICHDTDARGCAKPSNGYEHAMINKNALSVRQSMLKEVELLGFSDKDFQRVIKAASRIFQPNDNAKPTP